jgi:hypothetical protein
VHGAEEFSMSNTVREQNPIGVVRNHMHGLVIKVEIQKITFSEQEIVYNGHHRREVLLF